jgi:Uma2 family endonuclease
MKYPQTTIATPEIIYPESDGQPMAESDATRDYLIYCVSVLENYFQSRQDVYISGNSFIYYEEGNPKKVISPDVFVVFGVSQGKRPSYKTWESGGIFPQFIMEVTSRTTLRQDEVTKPELYRRLGVREYFQYDPTGDYLELQLKGQCLVDGVYQPMASAKNWLGLTYIHSQTLGLDLCLEPEENGDVFGLRFYDPTTREKLPNYIELVQLKQEELFRERQKTEAERQKAERLAEKLRSLGIDPDAED